jgi:hypothetical protein
VYQDSPLFVKGTPSPYLPPRNLERLNLWTFRGREGHILVHGQITELDILQRRPMKEVILLIFTLNKSERFSGIEDADLTLHA